MFKVPPNDEICSHKTGFYLCYLVIFSIFFFIYFLFFIAYFLLFIIYSYAKTAEILISNMGYLYI